MVQKWIAQAAMNRAPAELQRRHEASLVEGKVSRASREVAGGDDVSGQIAGVTAVILPPRLLIGRQVSPSTPTDRRGQMENSERRTR